VNTSPISTAQTDITTLLITMLSLGYTTSLLVRRPSPRAYAEGTADHVRTRQPYAEVYHALPRDHERFTNNLTDCFIELAKHPSPECEYAANAEGNPLPGINVKIMIQELSDAIVARANRACQELIALAEQAQSHEVVERSPRLDHFMKDVHVIRALLDSRRTFVRTPLLETFLQKAELVVSYIHGNPAAESLLRKIRAIVGSRHTHRPARPAEPVVAAQVVPEASVAVEVTEVAKLLEEAAQVVPEAPMADVLVPGVTVHNGHTLTENDVRAAEVQGDQEAK
jgi:hypothetical protein